MADPYRSGWCGPNGTRPIESHRRCVIQQCSCPCHAINAAAEREDHPMPDPFLTPAEADREAEVAAGDPDGESYHDAHAIGDADPDVAMALGDDLAPPTTQPVDLHLATIEVERLKRQIERLDRDVVAQRAAIARWQVENRKGAERNRALAVENAQLRADNLDLIARLTTADAILDAEEARDACARAAARIEAERHTTAEPEGAPVIGWDPLKPSRRPPVRRPGQTNAEAWDDALGEHL